MSDTDNRRIAAIGMFDGVHLGHQALVRELCGIAGDKGLIPTVFTFDSHPMELIAPERAPYVITTPAQRGDLLQLYGAADVFVLSFNDALRNLTAEDFMVMLRYQYGVDMLLLGFNHRFGSDKLQHDDEYMALGEKHGVEVLRSATTVYNQATHQAVSSSSIRTLIGAGDLAQANALMGHPMAIRGLVRHGNAVGRTIGFPTANLEPVIKRQILPPRGAYAAWAALSDGNVYPAMLNIGSNPTINKAADAPVRIEAHLIGFSGNLYEKVMDVQLVQRLRAEQVFAGIDDMARQLRADRETTLKILSEE